MRWLTLVLVSWSAAAFAEAPPAALDRQAVVQGMQAIRPKLQDCYAQYRVAGVASVDMTIAPSGTVARAAVSPPVDGWGDFQPDSPTAACIVRAVQGARFAQFSGTAQTLVYPIMLGGSAQPPDAALDLAQKAYVAGQFTEAIALAQQELADHPSRAWRVIGASSCFLQDAAGATTAWRALDAQGRSFVAFVCARHHVKLDTR